MPLKNDLAEFLLKQEEININGININFWTGHDVASISIQEKWNKIRSCGNLNKASTGHLGKIVLTGSFQAPKEEIAKCASKIGFLVHSNISKNTDYLVIGNDSCSPTKVARAIEIRKNGGKVKFIDELSFLNILDNQL